MALSFVDTDGTVYIPGAYPKWQAAQSVTGISTTGVLVLVGEADAGPDFTSEDIVALGGYGVNQRAAVIAKYGSGRLVDAYVQACKPLKDPAVRGAPARIYLVKTNKGTAATYAMASTYATLTAKQEGADGNLVQVKVTTPSDSSKRVITVIRKLDGVSETYTVGGNIGLTVNAAASVAFAIDGTGLTSAGAGAGAVAALNISFAQFKTLRDLAAYISSQTGWTATVVAAFGQKSPKVLDQGSYNVVVGAGAAVANVKMDAYEFTTALNGSRVLKVSVAPTAGLPANTALPFYLAGGAKGHTHDSDFIAALTAAKRVPANFVVPLVSQDASEDDEDTDAASDYTIAGVNAAVADHLALCSQFKQRKPRQGFTSIRDTYVNAKAAAQNMAYARDTMFFLDVMANGQNGLAWFQPWMAAVTAAAAQAACFYKPAFAKQLNINGARQAAADFTIEDPDFVEDALKAGLCPITPRDGGGFEFTSDQTTYGVDDNWVYNSFQAVYVADTLSMTFAQKMEKGFKGQNFADVSAGVALSFFKSVAAEARRLKLIKGDDEAPAGYMDANINITPPTMQVSAKVKEATGLYFIPLDFQIVQSTQQASA